VLHKRLKLTAYKVPAAKQLKLGGSLKRQRFAEEILDHTDHDVDFMKKSRIDDL
jgi:hypothetical protein